MINGMATTENLLYQLIQNQDNNSILVAIDLAIEMGCGLIIKNIPLHNLIPLKYSPIFYKHRSSAGIRFHCCAITHEPNLSKSGKDEKWRA